MECGQVIWITGLSGAGKTTLAKALLPHLPEATVLLDGDAMREALASLACGYDAGSRKKLAFTYSKLCKMIAEQGVVVVCATISMFHEVRAWNRKNLPGYFEVFIDMPEEVRMQRDYKKVYAKTGNEKDNVVGQTIGAEFPMSPDITLRDPSQPLDAMVHEVLRGCMFSLVP